jgi:Cap4 SAVED domain
MLDLGVNISDLLPWFPHEQDVPYVLIRVSAAHAASWADVLGVPLRRCYVEDDALEQNALRTGHSKSELLASKLPGHGSTMAGDFGEILVYLYHAVQEYPNDVIGPKKWRLKQDRTKPAPYSDVVHFVIPSWPQSTEDDQILCSEVKTKSTKKVSSPVTEAIADCEKDRTTRLAKTLVWLHELALGEDLGSTKVAHLERFINATDHPPAKKRFRAVVVVSANLVDDELEDAPDETPADYTVVVISVPDLKGIYEAVFDAALATVAEPGGTT